MSSEQIITKQDPPGRRTRDQAPVVIDVQGVEKTFRIPDQRVDSLKERMVHPFSRQEFRELPALRDVTFDVRKGEFFGIVGRNGSGKSTLLKIMASIYRADAGTIRMAGRLAPFIELGVGFNVDLSARENVVLNGVMMGLSRQEARRRLDAVLEFAELTDFAELKLKNYSSGMLVRLAFSVMIQSDADVLLIDEVLAVGDAAFQQKCFDFFREAQEAKKTVVLVTHDMATVQAFCDRAMLLHDGARRYLGDPEEAGRRYYRLNFGGAEAGLQEEEQAGSFWDVHARAIEAWFENEKGERITNVELGSPFFLNVVIEARRDLERPVFGFHFKNAEGVQVFGFNKTLSLADGEPDRLLAGQRVTVSGRIENPLMPDRYYASLWVGRDRNQGDIALQVLHLLDFVVFGTRPGPGIVSVESDVKAIAESSPDD